MRIERDIVPVRYFFQDGPDLVQGSTTLRDGCLFHVPRTSYTGPYDGLDHAFRYINGKGLPRGHFIGHAVAFAKCGFFVLDTLINIQGAFPESELGRRQQGSFVMNVGRTSTTTRRGSCRRFATIVGCGGCFRHAIIGTQGIPIQTGLVTLSHIAPNDSGVSLIVHIWTGCPKGRILIGNSGGRSPTGKCGGCRGSRRKTITFGVRHGLLLFKHALGHGKNHGCAPSNGAHQGLFG
eukprot:scaffold8028_cov165-Amphora_coffeaeformis.AAC.2